MFTFVSKEVAFSSVEATHRRSISTFLDKQQSIINPHSFDPMIVFQRYEKSKSTSTT